MNFKPSNLYISLIDLFAILLPGAISSLAIYHFYKIAIDGFLIEGNNNKEFFNGFVLLFASYLFGHIISQVSAYLDEWVYDRFKEKVFKDHKCVEKVMEIRKTRYGNEMNPVYVNTYKWSVFKLQKEYPDASAEVERYMADSKFFRGLFVILLVLGFVFSFQSGMSFKEPAANLHNFTLRQFDANVQPINKTRSIPSVINQKVATKSLKLRLLPLLLFIRPNAKAILKQFQEPLLIHLEIIRPRIKYPHNKTARKLNDKYQTFKNYLRVSCSPKVNGIALEGCGHKEEGRKPISVQYIYSHIKKSVNYGR